MAFKLAKVSCNTWEWPGTYKLYCNRPLPARGLMRTLLCSMRHEGEWPGDAIHSMQLAGGCIQL